MNVSNTRDLGANPTPKILLVGDSGTHKTWFLTTIPGIFVFDYDKGMAVARGKDVEYESFKDAPLSSHVHSKELGIYPYGQAWPAFILRINQLGDKIEQNPRPIGFDSLTTMSDICMNYVLREAGSPGKAPQIQHWGAQIELMKAVMDQISAWPTIFVATAHIQRNTNDVTQVIEQLPLLTGKLAGKIGIYFDEVWYTQVSGSGSDKKFTLKTESEGMFKQAKTRHGVPVGTDATWQAVEKYFHD